eukprot:IDg3890t1
MSDPHPRDFVRMLMVQKPDITRDVTSSRRASRNNAVFHVFECPRGDLCRSGGSIVFEKGTGFSNPFKHLRTCLADGDQQELIRLFNLHRDEKRQFGKAVSPEMTVTATKKEQAMFAYIRIIVLKSLPISYVEDAQVRSFSRFDFKFSMKLTKSVMFKLTELVEKRIAILMAGTKGAIIHDGWTSSGMHYLGVFVSFMRRVEVTRSGAVCNIEELCMPLLGVSPLAKNECASDDEAESFDAETHVQHLVETFKFFDQDLSKWVLCSIADNCSVNKRIARILNVPHVGCMSHKLSSEVNAMVRADASLENTIKSVQETMTTCKRRLTNRAILRNLTDLAPVSPNQTRWSGLKTMLCRFVEIHDDIIRAADMDGATISINRSIPFTHRAEKFAKMLTEIDTVTQELQKRHLSLSECRYAVDILRESVQEGRNDYTSAFFGCRLASKYIAPISATVTHPHFEAGVIKIQRGQENELNAAEKRACKSLLVHHARQATPSSSVNS